MASKLEKIAIESDYITLGQLLKKTGLIYNGGAAKFFLNENQILVNDVSDSRRGRKLRPGDKIVINNERSFLIKDANQES